MQFQYLWLRQEDCCKSMASPEKGEFQTSLVYMVTLFFPLFLYMVYTNSAVH